MVDVTEAINLQQDYTSRLIVLAMIFGFHLFIFYNQHKFSEEYEWQKVRNFFLRIFSTGMLLFSFMFVPIFLSEGMTLDNMLNLIAQAYGVGFALCAILVWVWMYDMILLMLSEVTNKLNFRRNYIFNKRRGKR